jgi:hypothetical protein
MSHLFLRSVGNFDQLLVQISQHIIDTLAVRVDLIHVAFDFRFKLLQTLLDFLILRGLNHVNALASVHLMILFLRLRRY